MSKQMRLGFAVEASGKPAKILPQRTFEDHEVRYLVSKLSDLRRVEREPHNVRTVDKLLDALESF